MRFYHKIISVIIIFILTIVGMSGNLFATDDKGYTSNSEIRESFETIKENSGNRYNVTNNYNNIMYGGGGDLNRLYADFYQANYDMTHYEQNGEDESTSVNMPLEFARFLGVSDDVDPDMFIRNLMAYTPSEQDIIINMGERVEPPQITITPEEQQQILAYCTEMSIVRGWVDYDDPEAQDLVADYNTTISELHKNGVIDDWEYENMSGTGEVAGESVETNRENGDPLDQGPHQSAGKGGVNL